MKRIKSFLITISSVLLTAFIALTLTSEWAELVLFVNDKLVGLGIPVVVISAIGVFVSEVWKQILNNRTIKQKGDFASGFTDYHNELY